MIGNLQILRAFAASGVVTLHSNATIFGVHTEFCGVSLFFCLSGYLMARICNRSAVEFALARFWRVVPSYWLAMALLLTVFRMWTYWPIEHTILSALFIPHQSPAGFFPVLGVGWTLNLEMYFYMIFTIAILINKKFAPLVAGGAVAVIYFLVGYLTKSEAILYYFANKRIWFFVIGIGIWYFSQWLKNRNIKLSLPTFTLPVSIAFFLVVTIWSSSISLALEMPWAIELFAVSLLFLISIMASNCGADLKPRFLLLMGDASYACYLLHTILIEFLRHKGIATSGTFLYTMGVLIGSWSLAILWHFYVDKYIVLLSKRTIHFSFLRSVNVFDYFRRAS